MDPMTAMAASGLRSRMESLDLVANNVANASTGGYKADREFYSLYASPEAADSEQAATMPVIERPWTDLAQGVIQPTGNALDLALSGKGFFAVQAPGGALYTRNGSFHLAADGSLVTADGYPVTGVGGAVLRLQTSGKIEISRDGTVSQAGQAVGQLQVVDFPGAAGLAKQGNNYFRSSSVSPASPADAATTVEQGKIEASNTGTAESAVRLINIMRQFEMLQKAASTALDMSKEAVEQVAKV
jgi:flagellar basal-body rod protein FlgF